MRISIFTSDVSQCCLASTYVESRVLRPRTCCVHMETVAFEGQHMTCDCQPLQHSYLSAAAGTAAGPSADRTENSTLWHLLWKLSQHASIEEGLNRSSALLQQPSEAVRAGATPAQTAAADASAASHQAGNTTPLSTATDAGAAGEDSTKSPAGRLHSNKASVLLLPAAKVHRPGMPAYIAPQPCSA